MADNGSVKEYDAARAHFDGMYADELASRVTKAAVRGRTMPHYSGPRK